MKFCAEITYDRGYDDEGNKVSDYWVHSDICFNCGPHTDKNKPLTDEHRQFLHDCLDEWLNQSNGTGAFWCGDPKYFVGWGG